MLMATVMSASPKGRWNTETGYARLCHGVPPRRVVRDGSMRQLRVLWIFMCLGVSVSGIALGVEPEEFEFSGGCLKESATTASREGGCKELHSGVVWGPIASKSKTYEEALQYCAGFKNGRWEEWKLPRLKDVARAVAVGIARENMNRNRIFDFFWLKDYTSGSLRHVAQLVENESAEREADDYAGTICVRQGVESSLGCALPETRYFITADGGCLYKKSHLVFSQRAQAAKNRTEAENYCADLIEGGKEDWQLPKLEELKTVAWDGGANRHFKFNVNGDFWTASQSETSQTQVAYYPQSDPRSLPSRYKIRTVEAYAHWVNLLTGKSGAVRISSSTEKYYYSGFPMGESSQAVSYDTSGVRASVVCVRP